MHSMGCHGCTAITCLTAQNSLGVTGVHAPPPEFLRKQLDTLLSDLPPRAVKVGMLGTSELAKEVGRFLSEIKKQHDPTYETPFVVVDPVMISTSGSRLVDDGAQEAMIEFVFPYADVLTPNKYEAEALLGRVLKTPKDVEDGARDILKMGPKAVLIKGGHSLSENNDSEKDSCVADVDGYAQDYFLSSDDTEVERLCDGAAGVWLRSDRCDTIHTHGTGCTLSSAIASALAMGHQQRELYKTSSSSNTNISGAMTAMDTLDACVLGKAYVTAGIDKGEPLGGGPGPVAHTAFPSSHTYFPKIVPSFFATQPVFPRLNSAFGSHSKNTNTLSPILPIVDSIEWVERLAKTNGVTDIQLRIKDTTLSQQNIISMVQAAQTICERHKVRLWINDHWEAAIAARCYGVHVGQEDLYKTVQKNGLEKLSHASIALGISTHSHAELAVALGIHPTYISLGPVFPTDSKNVSFDAQGLHIVSRWRQLIPPHVPLVAIGGIGDGRTARMVKNSGADCVAVISAVTKANDVQNAVDELVEAMS